MASHPSAREGNNSHADSHGEAGQLLNHKPNVGADASRALTAADAGPSELATTVHANHASELQRPLQV